MIISRGFMVQERGTAKQRPPLRVRKSQLCHRNRATT